MIAGFVQVDGPVLPPKRLTNLNELAESAGRPQCTHVPEFGPRDGYVAQIGETKPRTVQIDDVLFRFGGGTGHR